MSNEEKKEKEVPAKFKSIVEEVEKMSVLDLSKLVKVLEERFGVLAQSTVVAPSSGDTESAEEEKDSFDATLVSTGEQKVPVIKVIKEIFGLGLKEAKDIVDAAPSPLKQGLKKTEAEELKKKIEAVGGIVELK